MSEITQSNCGGTPYELDLTEIDKLYVNAE